MGTEIWKFPPRGHDVIHLLRYSVVRGGEVMSPFGGNRELPGYGEHSAIRFPKIGFVQDEVGFGIHAMIEGQGGHLFRAISENSSTWCGAPIVWQFLLARISEVKKDDDWPNDPYVVRVPKCWVCFTGPLKDAEYMMNKEIHSSGNALARLMMRDSLILRHKVQVRRAAYGN